MIGVDNTNLESNEAVVDLSDLNARWLKQLLAEQIHKHRYEIVRTRTREELSSSLEIVTYETYHLREKSK